jgi:hypothetical protein
VGIFMKIFKCEVSGEAQGMRRKPKSPSVKSQEGETPEVFEGKPFFIFKVEWMRSARGGVEPFLVVKSGEVVWVLTLEVLQTSRIFRGFHVVCAKETSFLKSRELEKIGPSDCGETCP